jgi:D-alanine-D-alanine ligase
MATLVLIAHNPVPPEADPSSRDVLEQAALVAQGLQELGLPFALWEVADPQQLALPAGVLVFNLYEAAPGQFAAPIRFVQALQKSGHAFTGSGSQALALTTHKLATRKHLQQAGLPVAPGEPFSGKPSFPPPWIAKPACEDASLGLGEGAVCLDEASLRQRVAWLQRRFPQQPVLVEQFLPGREFNVSLLAEDGHFQVLPVAEMTFPGFPPEAFPMVSYEAKWLAGSFADLHTVRSFPPQEDPLVAQVAQLALQAVLACGVQGYARVDLRCDAQGRPCILEVNANPCLAPEAGFLAAAAQGGFTPAQVVARILAAAERPCA